MSRFGVRGALVLVAAVPFMVAAFALSVLAVVVHLQAERSLDDATQVRDLGLLSQALVDVDSELAMLQTWSRTAALRTGATGDLSRLWIASQEVATDGAWADLRSANEVTPEVLASFDRLRLDLEVARSRFEADEVADLGAELGQMREEVRASLAAVQRAALLDGDASWASLVELTDARLAINAEAVAAIELLAGRRDATSVAEFDDLVRRTDDALDRTARTLTDASAERLATVMASEAAARWAGLRDDLLTPAPDSDSPATPDEIIAQLQLGSDFVRGVSSLARDTFDRVALDAETTGESAQRRRDLLVGVGVGALVLGVVVATLVGRRLSRRIARVSDLAEEVSAGRLDVGPLALAGRDEVARLARTMDDMVETLRATDAQIAALAAGRTDDPALDLDLPGSVGRNLRTALRRLGTSTAELQRRATHDALTGLADRHGLDLVVDELGRTDSGPIGVIVVDLDGFKQVNDEHGHSGGDVVLAAVARRLVSCARVDDVVARTGGDEFILVVPGATADGIAGIADRIVESTREPVDLDGSRVAVGASVGWVVAPTGLEVHEAIRRADRAMYDAKRTGKGRAIAAGSR